MPSGNRFTYRRLTGDEFARELERIQMPQLTFVRIFGQSPKSVERWITGEKQIPPWVPITLTLLTIPHGLGTARMAAAAMIEEDTRHPEFGKFPYMNTRNLPTDLEDGQ